MIDAPFCMNQNAYLVAGVSELGDSRLKGQVALQLRVCYPLFSGCAQ